MTETLTESRQATRRFESWELVERWCEHYPDDWRLLFQRGKETLEVTVPEEVWRAFDGIRISPAASAARTKEEA